MCLDDGQNHSHNAVGKSGLTLNQRATEVTKDTHDKDKSVWAPIDLAHLSKAASLAGDMGKGLAAVLGIPDTIYKYVPYEIFRHCLSETGSGTLRATQPLALNDILDCHVSTPTTKRGDGTPWEESVASSLTSLFPSAPKVTASNLRRRARRNSGDPRISNIIRDRMSRTWGVVSFTMNPLNKIMWGTYANSSSGFVVGYHTEAVKAIGEGMSRITYLDRPLRFLPIEGGCLLLGDQERDRIFESGGDNLSKILFLKGKEWSYELEVRLVVKLEDTEFTGNKDTIGQPIRVIRIPASAISEIYYGQNTPRTEVIRARSILSSGACSASRLFVVESVPGGYEYRARPE